MKSMLKTTAAGFVALHLVSCVAYMENQAARSGQTGDPTQGGFFGFSEELSNQRIAEMDRGQRAAQVNYNSKKAEEAQLRRQLAEAEKRLNEAATAEARAMAQRDISRLRRQILAVTSN
jgi:hypothetical protein